MCINPRYHTLILVKLDVLTEIFVVIQVYLTKNVVLPM